jgi:hypothetical protein
MISIGDMEKSDYFRRIARSSNNPVELQKKSSAKDLLDNAAKVCDTHCKVAYNISSKKKSLGEIAMSVDDEYLMNAAMHEQIPWMRQVWAYSHQQALFQQGQSRAQLRASDEVEKRSESRG